MNEMVDLESPGPEDAGRIADAVLRQLEEERLEESQGERTADSDDIVEMNSRSTSEWSSLYAVWLLVGNFAFAVPQACPSLVILSSLILSTYVLGDTQPRTKLHQDLPPRWKRKKKFRRMRCRRRQANRPSHLDGRIVQPPCFTKLWRWRRRNLCNRHRLWGRGVVQPSTSEAGKLKFCAEICNDEISKVLVKLHHQDDLRLRHVYRADVGHDVARSKKKEAIVARDEYQSEYYFPADRFVVRFRMTPMGLSTAVPASGPNIVPEGATVPSRAPEGATLPSCAPEGGASRLSLCLGCIGGHFVSIE